jgi:hypothetical protein
VLFIPADRQIIDAAVNSTGEKHSAEWNSFDICAPRRQWFAAIRYAVSLALCLNIRGCITGSTQAAIKLPSIRQARDD